MLYVGTSGYSYPYWRNRFYPEKLPVAKQLAYYATRLNALELNGTFYRFPRVAQLRKAALQTADDFAFSVKAHKIITHTLRLKNAREKIEEFGAIVREGLEDKLKCILYQMPPSYVFSDERLGDVVACLKDDKRSVIEFRHSSWWQDKVFDALKKASIVFCSVSYPGLPADNIRTGRFFYKRMHGVPELFKSAYTIDELTTLHRQLPETDDSFVFFNNTMFEAGYENALFFGQLK
ncbi:DUF72 domain-containing protein [Taibaiella soli]|uniref:DUF72 domain-containing protein n=1 Tax=Taibaiella soli TaxID=1649169 RepID=A0A2W2B5M7_9BACT|nr:DUF72 domain-containing protein [Taibaiella soli]PZF71287.1 DUF72 domain-containing protein [Taibaiella soli]